MVSANNDTFDGRPISDFFRIDHREALLIGCDKYDQLRQTEGNEKYSDLTQVPEDLVNVADGLKQIGFADN